MEPRSAGQGHAESEQPGDDRIENFHDTTSGGGAILSGSDPAAQNPGTETEAGTESQTTEAVSLLQSLRTGVSAGRAGSCVGSGSAQRRRTGGRWSEYRTNCGDT